jgi:hypothetical protein
MVCVVSQRTSKNEEILNIALTEGNYGIYFIDYQNEGMRNLIADSVPLIPFSSIVYLYPVEAQDNSIYCTGLAIPDPYFLPYSITDKTIFDQRIEVDLRNTTQDIFLDFIISESTYFRITTEQDIGMDVDLRVFNPTNEELGRAKDIGATETIVVKIPSSGRYKLQLIYRNSIIRDLMSCPQVHLYLSSLSEGYAKKLGQKQTDLLSQNLNSYEKIEGLFSKMQAALDNEQTFSNDGEMQQFYIFGRESYTSIEENVYENKLTNKNNKAYWIYFEVFSDQVFNDIVVDIDFEDRRFTKDSSQERKMSAGQTDQILRGKKGRRTYSMVMSANDQYNIQFLSRNVMDKITGFDDQLKHVMFQVKVQIIPVLTTSNSLSMTSILPMTFNNLRDMGISEAKNYEMIFFREKIMLLAKQINTVSFNLAKPSKVRLYLKSLVSGVGIQSVYINNSSGQKMTGNIIENKFNEFDFSHTINDAGDYTLNILVNSKKLKSGEFFMKLEVKEVIERTQCSGEKIPSFDDLAIVSKKSDTTQETHYYVGNLMFRNVYHLGQRQIGNPTDLYMINLPGDDHKNYKVIPFELKSASNLVSVNLFHDWAEDLVKLYILNDKEDPQDLFDVIRDQKKVGDHSNIPELTSIFQSKTLEYFDGIEKQFIPKGKYKLVIMNLDTTTDQAKNSCMQFSMSIYVEEQLKKRESKNKTGFLVDRYEQTSDSLNEAVIETMTLCQSSFVFNDMFLKPILVNGGYLSIDAVYRFDNDERWKKVMIQTFKSSVIYIRMTDIYNQAKSLEISLNVVLQDKKNPENEVVKVITAKKADKGMRNISEKYVEIQQFVKDGRYLLDFSKTVFDVDTDLFPCTRMKFELEVRPLKDVPEKLMQQTTCNVTAAKLMNLADPNLYDEVVRFDGYYPITEEVIKKIKFKIKEPTFLTLLVNFEKELSGGSMTLSISHVPNKKLDSSSKSKSNSSKNVPVYFSTDTSDGTSFIHQRLEPYISG